MATLEQALASLAINRPISHLHNAQFRNAEIEIKRALIEEAISFPGSTIRGKFIYSTVWEEEHYSVKFGKYGKEYYRVGINRNINDMLPVIFKDSEICDFDASFRAIFRLSEHLKNIGDTNSLLILGCLFIRNAFLVDHAPKGESYRYVIPDAALEYLKEHIGTHSGVPIEPFLMYVDAIAWQEDVKYTTLGKSITSDIGRKNNMLTYSRFIACLLGRSSYAEMLNRFSMGVSALPKKEIPTTYPELSTSY